MSSSPLMGDTRARAAHLSIRLVAFTQLLRLTPPGNDPGIDRDQILASLDQLARLGIGRGVSALQRHFTSETAALLLDDVLAAVEASPMPAHEWAPVSDLLGDELLASVVGASLTSIHRYRTGERPTPDRVAARLHTVALIAADLAGSYNEFGIRRWFGRPRSVLAGRSPAQILVGDWSPDELDVRSVCSLARALLGASAA